MKYSERDIGYIIYCHKQHWKNFSIPSIIGVGTLINQDGLILYLENNHKFKAMRVGAKSNGKKKGFKKGKRIGEFLSIEDHIKKISLTSAIKPNVYILNNSYIDFLNICNKKGLNKQIKKILN